MFLVPIYIATARGLAKSLLKRPLPRLYNDGLLLVDRVQRFSMVFFPDPDPRGRRETCKSSRKRPSEASQETSSSPKRHRPHYPPTIPSRFWDNLSKVPLTRNALRELNRREEERQIASHIADQEQQRVPMITRSTRRKLEQQDYRQQSAEKLLGQFSPTSLKQVRRFSSHGGPDLSDLIGVCVSGTCEWYPLIMY